MTLCIQGMLPVGLGRAASVPEAPSCLGLLLGSLAPGLRAPVPGAVEEGWPVDSIPTGGWSPVSGQNTSIPLLPGPGGGLPVSLTACLCGQLGRGQQLLGSGPAQLVSAGRQRQARLPTAVCARGR